MGFLPQRFWKGYAGVLKFDPSHGKPTSGVTVALYKNDGTALQSATAMTAGASTTFDANSGASSSDPYLVNLTATTNFAVGDRVLLENATGQSEIIEVQKVTSGASIRSVRKLKHDYVNADTATETTYTYSVTSTHTANAFRFGKAVFEYTAGGVARVEVLPFHVLLQVFESQLKEDHLYQLFPDLDRFTGYQQSFQPQINAAFEHVYSELVALKIDPDLLKPGRFELAHAYKALFIIVQRWSLNQPDTIEYLSSVKETYDAHFKQLTDISNFYDDDESGTASSDEVFYLHGYHPTPSSFQTDNPLDLESDELTPIDDPIDPVY